MLLNDCLGSEMLQLKREAGSEDCLSGCEWIWQVDYRELDPEILSLSYWIGMWFYFGLI